MAPIVTSTEIGCPAAGPIRAAVEVLVEPVTDSRSPVTMTHH